jgi:hypothetical protein
MKFYYGAAYPKIDQAIGLLKTYEATFDYYVKLDN